jgi:hypothetical protein
VSSGAVQWNQESGAVLNDFDVDTCALRCYKPLKEKLFGGESPIDLLTATRE